MWNLSAGKSWGLPQDEHNLHNLPERWPASTCLENFNYFISRMASDSILHKRDEAQVKVCQALFTGWFYNR